MLFVLSSVRSKQYSLHRYDGCIVAGWLLISTASSFSLGPREETNEIDWLVNY